MQKDQRVAATTVDVLARQAGARAKRTGEPFEVAEKAGINPYQGEYDEAVRFLLDNGYIEQYPNSSYWLYRVTNKGLEEVLKG